MMSPYTAVTDLSPRHGQLQQHRPAASVTAPITCQKQSRSGIVIYCGHRPVNKTSPHLSEVLPTEVYSPRLLSRRLKELTDDGLPTHISHPSHALPFILILCYHVFFLTCTNFFHRWITSKIVAFFSIDIFLHNNRISAT